MRRSDLLQLCYYGRMNLSREKRLWKRGYKYVVGLDEAGRGPLAGPVVACTFVIKNKRLTKSLKYLLSQIKDSKKLSKKKREELFELIKNNYQVEWGTGKVSEKIIDKINILESSKLAMKRAVLNLEKKLGQKVEFLLIDGNFKIDSEILQKSIIRGDDKIFSIAASSIMAKVTRDRIMKKYDKKFPEYGFSKHKGYPTKLHRKMIKKHGICKIHRKTFKLL